MRMNFALIRATIGTLMLALAACSGGGTTPSAGFSTGVMSAAVPAAVTPTTAPTSVVPVAQGDPVFFSASNYSIAQDSAFVSVTVFRVGDSSAGITVDYETADASAVAGVDYTATRGTLHWGENDSIARTILVPISSAHPFNGSKSFSVALSRPEAPAKIGSPDLTLVTILGSDTKAVGAAQFSSSTYSVNQSTNSLVVSVSRLNGSVGPLIVDYSTASGSAAAGADFSPVSGALSWSDGDATTRTFSIPINNEVAFAGTKSFSVLLAGNGSGGPVTSSASVVIDGALSPPPGSFYLSASLYPIAQGSGSLTVFVYRQDGTAGPVSVSYATSDGTAVAGADYAQVTGTLSWTDGDSSAKAFSIPIGNASAFSGAKAFTVNLSNPGNGATIGGPGAADVVISGSASSAMGILGFEVPGYVVAQNAGTATLSVERIGGSSGTASVQYQLQSGTAVAGEDFTGSGGILQWADGDSSSKTIPVAITAGMPFAGKRSFTVELSNPTGGAVLGSPGRVRVTIDGAAATAAGGFQLSATQYAIPENGGMLTMIVNRTGGSTGAVSVNYATAAESAVAGTDFVASSGTLYWADGDAGSKALPIEVTGGSVFSGVKSFVVRLSSPVGGATLSSPSGAAGTIYGTAGPSAGSLHLSSSNYAMAQNAGILTVFVYRTGGSEGAASVGFSTVNGTAVGGTDFAGVTGTLYWSDGDTEAKMIQIPVSAATPFSGTKSFSIALSNPGAATLDAPSNATVTISGTGSANSGGPNGPSAPTGLLMTGQTTSSISLAWSAAVPGRFPVAYYKIYRNGSFYDSSTVSAYVDVRAVNATNAAFTAASNVYGYTVSAVDSQGNEGPQATQVTFQVYYNGIFNFASDYSYDASADYRDTGGFPESGPYDIAISVTSPFGGFQPYAGNVVPQWDLELGSFGYVSIDLKPTIPNQSWRLSMISRLPPGDVYPWSSVNVTDYGPAPVVGQWATYKIPLSALTIGNTGFEGSISGTTLTVTTVDFGVGVDAGGFITGNGVIPGTYILGSNANGGPGTYTIYPAQNVASTAMTEHRTSLYKFSLQDRSGAATNLFYIDNLLFTTE